MSKMKEFDIDRNETRAAYSKARSNAFNCVHNLSGDEYDKALLSELVGHLIDASTENTILYLMDSQLTAEAAVYNKIADGLPTTSEVIKPFKKEVLEYLAADDNSVFDKKRMIERMDKINKEYDFDNLRQHGFSHNTASLITERGLSDVVFDMFPDEYDHGYLVDDRIQTEVHTMLHPDIPPTVTPTNQEPQLTAQLAVKVLEKKLHGVRSLVADAEAAAERQKNRVIDLELELASVSKQSNTAIKHVNALLHETKEQRDAANKHITALEAQVNYAEARINKMVSDKGEKK